MNFINDNFLLSTPLAERLFHEIAADLPIIDYHNHLPPDEIAGNRQFENLYDIWLAGDHYKWRAMRADGVAEEYCTGDADPYDKFMAWARTVPNTLRNPLYHWSHIELKRYFGIDELLNEKTAPVVWEKANARLADADRSVHGILKDFRIEVLCTTDDPADDLAQHRAIAESGIATRVYPAFRPDALLRINDPAFFNDYVERLAGAADKDVTTLTGLLDAVSQRHDYFHSMGCRLSDHGLSQAYDAFCSEQAASVIYDKARGGQSVSAEEAEQFATFIMVYTGCLDAEKGWVKQLHLGPLRSVRSRMLGTVGPDIGFDTVGDLPQAHKLARYLDRLDADGMLPKTILYNLNPADNYVMATMAGSFMDGSVAGKVQYGSGWWFLDQLEGMRWQMNALSSLGLLSRFVGMLTDSRSFMSFPRHEYFRRLLCEMLGEDVERGLVPDDFDLLAEMVKNICHDNAERFFAFPQSP